VSYSLGVSIIFLTATGVFIGAVMSSAFVYAWYKASKLNDWSEAPLTVIACWVAPLLIVAATVAFGT
jgi:CBS domain containing-hemolysin-like protein